MSLGAIFLHQDVGPTKRGIHILVYHLWRYTEIYHFDHQTILNLMVYHLRNEKCYLYFGHPGFGQYDHQREC